MIGKTKYYITYLVLSKRILSDVDAMLINNRGGNFDAIRQPK